ncbi:MAG: ComF family protein [Caldilinea sp.]|uniref:ComF family protein n=1 Tax=Caldilinea sp. TaxID=2293560 RepID=UPI002BDB27CE|nr:ComF family protein [Anaerolineales bacterium]HQY92202.1 ComF family protein [Caldilinea sp.]HRA66086.1 ComF family protein [Caldilinea sp.]
MIDLQRASGAMSTWAAAGVDFLFPPRCAGCGRAGQRICAHCAQLVTPTPATICERCGRVQSARVQQCSQCADGTDFPLYCVRAAALHISPLREWIHLLKYEGRRDLGILLARYLTAALAAPDWAAVCAQLDGVIPAPLHAERLRERGYNQAELLAVGLCRQTGLPLHTDLLRREKLTRSQVGLNAAERKANVEAAFVAAPACRGLRLLLIDDVYTTGATLRACAHALLDAGATQVSALTLALPTHIDPSMTHDLSHS